jgi:hypothetical protein
MFHQVYQQTIEIMIIKTKFEISKKSDLCRKPRTAIGKIIITPRDKKSDSCEDKRFVNGSAYVKL